MKLYAYGTLANFWVTVGAKDAVDEMRLKHFFNFNSLSSNTSKRY